MAIYLLYIDMISPVPKMIDCDRRLKHMRVVVLYNLVHSSYDSYLNKWLCIIDEMLLKNMKFLNFGSMGHQRKQENTTAFFLNGDVLELIKVPHMEVVQSTFHYILVNVSCFLKYQAAHTNM